MALHREMQSCRPALREKFQDYLMDLLMQDHALRTRMLRFVDVLAALPEKGADRETASLFREYFRTNFSNVPLALRLAISAAGSSLIPDSLLTVALRRGTRFAAGNIIVAPGSETVGRTLRDLGKDGRNASFDILGEAVVSEEEARGYRRAYLDLLNDLSRQPLARVRTRGGAPCLEVSVKLSSLTSQFKAGCVWLSRPPVRA